MADALELELAGETCARCDTDMVITYDALRRPRKRCPKCDGVSKKAAPNPDTVLQPIALGTVVLPPIAPGQLRCQRCAHGVEANRRWCERCIAESQRLRLCLRCGASTGQYGPGRPRLLCERCVSPAQLTNRQAAIASHLRRKAGNQ